MLIKKKSELWLLLGAGAKTGLKRAGENLLK